MIFIAFPTFAATLNEAIENPIHGNSTFSTCGNKLEPVCAGGIEYSNLCVAELARVPKDQIKNGKCESAKICTLEFGPVCANGIQYSNTCFALRANVPKDQIKQGKCQDGQTVCTSQYEPVCANGTSYSNSCFALLAKVPKDQITIGECNYSSSASYIEYVSMFLAAFLY